MDPKHLVQLAEIVDLGSMSRAAAVLNVTQPTLSRTVRMIEDRVGNPVLRRGRYGVTATMIGERLAEEGRAIRRRSRNATHAIEHWRHGLTGELRIGVGPMISASLMGGFLGRALASDWPYSVRVTIEFASRVIKQLNENELDAAILPAMLNLNQELLLRELLFTDILTVYARYDHPLRTIPDRTDPSELAKYPWLETAVMSGFTTTNRDVMKILNIEDHAPKLSFAGDVIMPLQVVASTDALCILPRWQVERLIGSIRISELDLGIELPDRNIALWINRARQDRPEIHHFRRELLDFLRSEQAPG